MMITTLLQLLILPVFLSTFSTGTITGTVVNSVTKEPIAGATVMVVGTKFGAATDTSGAFVITNIPVGTFQVQASAVGFRPNLQTNIVVSSGMPAILSFEMNESELSIGGVTVTADYFQKNTDEPVSVQTLGYEEIRRLPGGLEDVARAVAILPGVAQVQTGRNDLIVRGGAPSENLFIVDNIQFPNINHFATQGASGGPLSFINLDFVDATEFSSGGFSVRYGDKLSSVLRIKLRDGRTDHFGGKATISASQFGLNLEGPIEHDGSFLFSARRSYLDFIFKAAGLSFIPEYWDFTGKVNYHLGKNDEITFLGIGALDDVKLLNNTPEQRYDNSRILRSNQNEAVGGISWRHLLPKGYATASLSQTIFTYDYRQDDTLTNPIFTNNSVESETSLRGDVVLKLGTTSELSLGAEGTFASFSDKIFLKKFYTNYSDSLRVNTTLDTTAFKSAGYIQLTQSFSERLKITAGIRADHFNLIAHPFAFSPRLSATFMLDAETNINASVGQYKQSPAYVWLAANPENRQLKFISAVQYILGIDHLLRSDTKISIEGYIKNYSDYPASLQQKFLVLSNAGSGFGGSQEAFASFGIDPLVSDGSGKASGVEFFLQKQLSEIPFYGIVSISYNYVEFTALDGVARPGSFDQRWIINIGGGYVMNEAWEFSGKFRFFTGRPYTPYNPDGTQNAALYNSARIGANHGLDLRVDRRWNFSDWTLVTYADVQNVYNRKPLDVPIFDERTKEVKQISNTIGILPSIGISAMW